MSIHRTLNPKAFFLCARACAPLKTNFFNFRKLIGRKTNGKERVIPCDMLQLQSNRARNDKNILPCLSSAFILTFSFRDFLKALLEFIDPSGRIIKILAW